MLHLRSEYYRPIGRTKINAAYLPQHLPGRLLNDYMTAEGKALKERYQWEARAQWRGKLPEGDVELGISLYFGTTRKADWDNFHKLSCDALTGIIYNDDSQVTKAIVIKHYDKLNPRIEILVL